MTITTSYFKTNHYFFLYHYNTQHSVVTDGNCSKHCGSLSVPGTYNDVFVIDHDLAIDISNCLKTCSVWLDFASNVNIAGSISWQSDNNLTITSLRNVVLSEGVIVTNSGDSTLKLMAGIDSTDDAATVIFQRGSSVRPLNGATAKIYYNPSRNDKKHKYHNPSDYDSNSDHLGLVESYMLVNNVADLQDIRYFSSGNYALSRTITGDFVHNFIPLGLANYPFSGNFDGNGYGVVNLKIKAEENVAIFGVVSGSEIQKNNIGNLWIKNITVAGSYYVGIFSSSADYTVFHDIIFKDGNSLEAEAITGGLVGTGSFLDIFNVTFESELRIIATAYSGFLAGALHSTSLNVAQCDTNNHEDTLTIGHCVGIIVNDMLGE